MTQTAIANSFTLPNYRHSLTHLDTERYALWHYLNPEPRPVFSRVVLGEILDVQERVKLHLSKHGENEPEIRYLIIASAIPGVFSLGGDLELFADLIRNRDRDRLLAYGRLCIECVFNSVTNVGNPQLTTISLVQGTALGGGFEAALANNVVVAERSATFGLPEILFNLFPGMGAYSLLARRLDMARAERFLASARQYTAAELHELGIVDVLAEDGQGVHAVNSFIRKHGRSRNGLLAIQQVRQRLSPLAFQELEDVVMIWVDTAMRLTERDLRTMEKLVAAQHRLAKRNDSAGVASAAQGEQLVYAGAA
ncbi:MAG TPA: crotonase/enoyl-CoA hydratase family protein [Acidiferrobacterales bacterium]|nr:crotonase/enoyl-CoA hydratase family protein [Acidiferrobacterales bacterium]